MRTTAQIKQELDRKVAEIRGYADLTPEAKQRRIAEAYAEAEREYREAVAEEEQKIRERAEKAEKAVFEYGHPFSASKKMPRPPKDSDKLKNSGGKKV